MKGETAKLRQYSREFRWGLWELIMLARHPLIFGHCARYKCCSRSGRLWSPLLALSAVRIRFASLVGLSRILVMRFHKDPALAFDALTEGDLV